MTQILIQQQKPVESRPFAVKQIARGTLFYGKVLHKIGRYQFYLNQGELTLFVRTGTLEGEFIHKVSDFSHVGCPVKDLVVINYQPVSVVKMELELAGDDGDPLGD